MTITQHIAAVQQMKALRDEIRERLLKTSDYRALIALDKAIDEVESAGKPHSVTLRGTMVMGPEPYIAIERKRPITQTDAAFRALQDTGYPLPTAELMKKAIELGAEVGGANPVVNFGSSLSRDFRFQNVRYRGQRAWWPMGKPVPTEDDIFAEKTEPADTP